MSRVGQPIRLRAITSQSQPKKKTPLGTDARKKPGTSKVDCMKGKGKEKATRNVTVIRNTVKEVFLLEVC
jgi:hypothetical protein